MSKSFSLILVLFAILSADTIKETSSNLFLNPMLRASAKVPYGSSQDFWEKFPAGGIYFEIPSFTPQTRCILGADAAKIENKNDIVTIKCLHLQLGFEYVYQTPCKFLSLIPSISLTNTMTNSKSKKEIWKSLKRLHVFSDVENEFGINVGIEPRIVYKHFFVGLPMQFERTFSSPDPFDLLLISFNAGYIITL